MSSESTGTARLHDDRSGVELRRDEMHRGAAHLDAVLECLPLRVDAREMPEAATDER